MAGRDERRPLSDAERAERIRQLEELRALAQQRQQNALNTASHQVSCPADDGAGGDTHDAPISDLSSDDARQRAEDEFCDLVETHIQQHGTLDEHGSFFSHDAVCDDEMRQHVVTEKANWRRREMGDFELLRLAKMGDNLSFEEFKHMSGIDCTRFVDNTHRNALHYAADGGNAELIESLIQSGVPSLTDEKGLTPLDIALLNEHSNAVLSLLSQHQGHTAAPSRSNAGLAVLNSMFAASSSYRSAEQLLNLFAPNPPLFVLSKPAEPIPVTTRGRSFWASQTMHDATQTTSPATKPTSDIISGAGRHSPDSCVSSSTTLPAVQAGVEVRTEIVRSSEDAATVRGVIATLMHEAGGAGGLRDWLAPVMPVWQHEAGDPDRSSNPTMVVVVRAYETMAAEQEKEDISSGNNTTRSNTVGVLLGCVLDGALAYPAFTTIAQSKSSSRNDASSYTSMPADSSSDSRAEPTRTRMVVANYLSVHPSRGGSGVAVAMMRALGAYARSSFAQQHNRDSTSSHAGHPVLVMFSTNTPLPQPPFAMCMMKWYSRVLRVRDVFAQDYAGDIMPDFFRYDTTLRADLVLRGSVPESLCARYTASMQEEWVRVRQDDAAQITEVRTFLSEHQRQLAKHQHSSGSDVNDSSATRNKQVGAASSGSVCAGMDVMWCPTTDEEVRRCMCEESNSRLYLRRAATAAGNAITDVVVFRLRQARSAQETAATMMTSGAIAQVSFALFTTLSGTVKVQHVLLLAHMREQAAVLLIPTSYGFTDSDLAKSNFDEIDNGREFVYAVDPFDHVGQVVPAVPAAKVCLPLFFC